MKRTTKYVALDVHQATTSATVREDGGRVVARSVLPTTAPTLVEFFRGMRGAIHVAFEEGTQAQWLHDLLVPIVDRVIVADRRGASAQANKGDQVDADQLSELLRLGALRAVYHSSPHRETLRELARAYLNLVEDSTRVMQRLKALFRARGIPTPGKQVYHPAQQAQWVALLTGPGVRFRATALYAELEVLRELRPQAKAALLTEAGHDADTLAISHETESLGVCGARGGQPIQCRLSARAGSPGATPACPDDPWPQPQSQSGAQERVQERRHSGDGTAWGAADLLSHDGGPRDARGSRARHPNAKARRAHPSTLEDGRPLRSNPADSASAVTASSSPREGAVSALHRSGFRTRVREAVPSYPFARHAVRRGTRLTMVPPAGPE